MTQQHPVDVIPRVRVLGAPDTDTGTAAVVDHVLLSYDYLDRHDVDGYLSLVEPDVVALLPPGEVHRGQDALAAQLGRAMVPGRPETVTVVHPSVVVVTGRMRTPVGAGPARAFVDVIVAGEHRLIKTCQRVVSTT